MLREITWEQFLEWQAFDALDPIGDKRGDWQAAAIIAALGNIIAAAHGAETRFSTEQFLLVFGDTPTEVKKVAAPNWQRMKMIGQMWAALANADEKRKKERHGRRSGHRNAVGKDRVRGQNLHKPRPHHKAPR